MEITTFDTNAKIPENKLVYIVTMQEKRETLKGWMVNVKRSDPCLNDTIDQDPFAEILFITAKVYYDLDLEISNHGKILKVCNIKAIREKWKELRYKVEHTYTGNNVTPVIESVEKALADDAVFLNLLKRDLFFRYYFLFYGEYENGQSREIENLSLYGLCGRKPLSCDAKAILTKDKERGTKGEIRMTLDTDGKKAFLSHLKKEDANLLKTDLSGHCLLLPEQKHMEKLDFLLTAHWENQLMKRMQLTLKTIENYGE